MPVVVLALKGDLVNLATIKIPAEIPNHLYSLLDHRPRRKRNRMVLFIGEELRYFFVVFREIFICNSYTLRDAR